MKIQSRLFAAMLAAGVVAGTAQAATVDVTRDVVANTTWSRTNTYVLHDPIYVRDGATLTIQSGTLVRGTPQTGGTNDAPGALIVSRTGTIMANGSATQPIVFTDMDDNHFVGPTPTAGTAPYNQKNNFIAGKWGGVIVLGDAYITYTADGTKQIEGLEPAGDKSRYGGTNDDDDSGDLTFVSIRHGGFVIGASNEINGLSMGGVGRGTKIQNIEVYQTRDDGFEWFGGTVDTKYLVAWSFGDDGFDWDEGFRGRGQFWMAVKGLATGKSGYDVSDNMCEMDGAIGGDDKTPASSPTIFNATLVGHGPDSTNVKYAANKDLCWLFRDGTGGRWLNSMVLDCGGALALIEGSLTDGNTFDPADKTQQLYTRDSYNRHYVQGMNKLAILNSVWWGIGAGDAQTCSNGVTSGVYSGKYWGGDDDKNHLGAENGYSLLDGTKMNTELGRGLDAMPIFALTRSATATDGIYPVEYIDPTLLNASYMNCKLQPPSVDIDSSRFFSPVAFQGAFGDANWAAWTYVAKLGMMPTDNYGVYEGPGGTGLVNAQIVTNGNYASFTMDPGVNEGYMGDVSILYRYGDPRVNVYYNFKTGLWSETKTVEVMPIRKLNLVNILDLTTVPADAQIVYQIDQTPDANLSSSPRFKKIILDL